MSPDGMSERALALVRQHVDSVGRLDLLIVLYGDPRVRWTAGRMAKQMKAPAKWAQTQMRALERAGVLSCRESDEGPAWGYEPADEQVAEAVQDLVEACRLDWPAVTREVMSLRPGGAQAFSDAFKLKRRNDG